ncbi:MAG: hypothetical protein E6Q85_00495 [Thiothrix sp.]|nr:MAG: hypothetical protein E6Q85_00495 [Thiothrix sp.]
MNDIEKLAEKTIERGWAEQDLAEGRLLNALRKAVALGYRLDLNKTFDESTIEMEQLIERVWDEEDDEIARMEEELAKKRFLNALKKAGTLGHHLNMVSQTAERANMEIEDLLIGVLTKNSHIRPINFDETIGRYCDYLKEL